MRFCYIQTGNDYAPDKHLMDGLRENGHIVFELIENDQKFGKRFRFAWRFWKNNNPCDAVIIGYSLPILVPIVRCLSGKKVIFNAVSSQYEANIVSRETDSPWSLRSLKWWIMDFISFHFSSHVLLESNAQTDFVHRLFLVPRKKLFRSWMGVDEKVFFRDSQVKKDKKFTILFRGRFLPESGILTVIETAKKLEDKDVQFLIIGHGFMYREVNALMDKLKPKNIEMVSERLPGNALRERMLGAHISLGQLANHPRLSRTLPAKLYESLALGLPYLTGRNAGILELLKEDETCIATEPGNPDDLAKKILYLRDNPRILQKVAENGYQLYKERLTSKKLADDFMLSCFKNK